MSKSISKPTIKTQILESLEDGEKSVDEIYKVVSGQKASIRAALRSLERDGEIESPERGRYHLPTTQDAPAEVKNPRGEAENTETINKMLNLYDKLLDAVAGSIEKEDWGGITEKIEAIKSLRYLGATVDQLMKRWYLLYRGYDANTRQAVEDAKKKTVDQEKQETENAPPEDQLNVVRNYDESMRDILENMPHTEQEKTKV